MILSTKDLVFKERPTRKLIERYMGLYMVEEVVFVECSKITITKVDENSSSNECEPDSSI